MKAWERNKLALHASLSRQLDELLEDHYGDVGDLEGSAAEKASRIENDQEKIEEALFDGNINLRVDQLIKDGQKIKVRLKKGRYDVEIGVYHKTFSSARNVDMYLLGYHDAC